MGKELVAGHAPSIEELHDALGEIEKALLANGYQIISEGLGPYCAHSKVRDPNGVIYDIKISAEKVPG